MIGRVEFQCNILNTFAWVRASIAIAIHENQIANGERWKHFDLKGKLSGTSFYIRRLHDCIEGAVHIGCAGDHATAR